MKIWMLALILFLAISISQAHAGLYHVTVQTRYGFKTYAVEAPTDSIALDSVFVSAIYNKRLKKVTSATVEETGLSTLDLPQRSFEITTEKKDYLLNINVVDPEFAMTVIQAAKILMSSTTAREIHSRYNRTTLKSRSVKKYTLLYKGKQVTHLLNVNRPEEGIYAFDIAARIAERGQGYISTAMTSVLRENLIAPRFNCMAMFQH